MIRIGIDARFMLRQLRGMPLYVLRLCQNIPSINPEYQYFFFINKGFEHNDSPDVYLPRIKEIEKNHPNVTFVNYDHDGEVKWEQVILPRLLKKYNIDLLHMPGNRMCFRAGIPTVATLHDVMEYRFLLDQKYPLSWKENKSLRMFQYNLRRRLYAILTYRWGLSRANRIISVSNYSKNDIVDTIRINENNVSVIYHGVDDEYLDNNIIRFEDRNYTLMLGGDSHQKNPETALACWSKVDPALRNKYPLKIIGFNGTAESPLSGALRKYQLDSDVEVLGWVKQEEIVRYFKYAALFLFPSRYEGFGFPLIQAMVSGTPVVSTNKSSIPEILDTVGFQSDPDDVSAMVDAVHKLLTDMELWKHQSHIGVERGRQFSWNNCAAKHLEIYNQFLTI